MTIVDDQVGGARGVAGGDRLLLADTPSLYFRAFHGVPRSVRAPDGMAVNAVRGLLDVLARQIGEVRPRRLVCCFDADWRPAFRVALMPSYKAHRVAGPPAGAGNAAGAAGEARVSSSPGVEVAEEVPDELEAQLPVIDAVLDAFGIARVQAAGFEADDVIATLATRHSVGGPDAPGAPGGPVDILTGDRDLFQLVDDGAGVAVRYAVEKFVRVDEASITARYGVPGRAYADFAVLRGDPSDGLPGVAGIGAKTAAALLGRFGSLEGILAAVDAGVVEGFPARARGRLEASREYLAAAVGVVAVVRDVPLGPVADVLPAGAVDAGAVEELARRYGLDGPVGRLAAALAAVAVQGAVQGAGSGGAGGG
ncbi:5'-3' exonuclease [Parafrankia colletiae]|uniref:5'-3' exonuclease n=1 Tax=Parafrankia colletiae TaxID=573497 RepID=A0A1S1R5T9_9ACTN|nr:5'-3' exonuclease [Parafrankia colletiae]MCK9900736.1 5'-3' exonuclease [Frankia sp. Cpl3]OHV42313.1 5'-3' exonuclease [Parafrankia colletiae]